MLEEDLNGNEMVWDVYNADMLRKRGYMRHEKESGHFGLGSLEKKPTSLPYSDPP